MKSVFVCCLMLAAASFSSLVHADDTQLYRWTDTQGVIHYSDQPPTQAVADLATTSIPVFPAIDQAKVDKEQAALLAQAAALQQLAAAQAAADAQARIAAAQQVAAQPQPAVSTEDVDTVAPIYVSSAFVPRIYRANLYLPRRPAGHVVSMRHAVPHRPAIPLSSRP
jgi:hypothetical protein